MARTSRAATADAPTTAPPNISVLERRLQNPFGDGSPAIRLKEPGWTLHVINANLRPGRYHDVTRNKGWVPVEATEIDGDPLDFGFDVKDGRVVRGERGQEVLVKMPTAWAQKIAMTTASTTGGSSARRPSSRRPWTPRRRKSPATRRRRWWTPRSSSRRRGPRFRLMGRTRKRKISASGRGWRGPSPSPGSHGRPAGAAGHDGR